MQKQEERNKKVKLPCSIGVPNEENNNQNYVQ